VQNFTTLQKPCGPVLVKEKKSKFLGFGYPVKSSIEAKELIENLKSEFADATHICYAYKIGLNQPEIRMSDDGEPAYSAGAPIFGQLEAFDLCNVLICVVRYYGGTKLGVGGLIQAYREAAKLCLASGTLISVTPQVYFKLDFEYNNLDVVMRILSHNRLHISQQEMGLSCSVTIMVDLSDSEKIAGLFSAITDLRLLRLP
jgi:uncharacterized YigZ family protein